MEVVVVTAPRKTQYSTKEEAVGAAISAFQANPNRANRELGVFVLEVGNGYELGEVIVGPDDQSLGSFSETGENGTIKIPANAVGLVHSHPPSNDTNRNLYPSANDMLAWQLFEKVTNESNFTMWLVGRTARPVYLGKRLMYPQILIESFMCAYPSKFQSRQQQQYQCYHIHHLIFVHPEGHDFETSPKHR